MGPSEVAFLNFNQPDNLTQFIGEQSEHKGGMNKNDKMTSQILEMNHTSHHRPFQ